MMKTPFSIGICAYNEGSTIERCIRSIYSQTLNEFVLQETIVVSSASTDKTNEIVKSLMDEYTTLKLVQQEKREGKNVAINNFLDMKQTEIVVIVNADNILANENSLQKLLEPFHDLKVGIVGGHPIPQNSNKTYAGFASNLIWTMHHYVALECPKIGELIAYRDIGTRLPAQHQSDEDIIKLSIEKAGYLSKYVPEAIVFNRGPETLRDLKKQRIRVNIGQSYMLKEKFYNPTRDSKILVNAFRNAVKSVGFHPIKTIVAVFIEIYCRLMSRIVVKCGFKDDNVWDPVESTKKV